jgi:hypothetical protein
MHTRYLLKYFCAYCNMWRPDMHYTFEPQYNLVSVGIHKHWCSSFSSAGDHVNVASTSDLRSNMKIATPTTFSLPFGSERYMRNYEGPITVTLFSNYFGWENINTCIIVLYNSDY